MESHCPITQDIFRFGISLGRAIILMNNGRQHNSHRRCAVERFRFPPIKKNPPAIPNELSPATGNAEPRFNILLIAANQA